MQAFTDIGIGHSLASEHIYTWIGIYTEILFANSGYSEYLRACAAFIDIKAPGSREEKTNNSDAKSQRKHRAREAPNALVGTLTS